jgi:hypothetical protein
MMVKTPGDPSWLLVDGSVRFAVDCGNISSTVCASWLGMTAPLSASRGLDWLHKKGAQKGVGVLSSVWSAAGCRNVSFIGITASNQVIAISRVTDAAEQPKCAI